MEDRSFDFFPGDGAGSDGATSRPCAATNGSKQMDDDCQQDDVPLLVPALNASMINSSSSNSTPGSSIAGGGSGEMRGSASEKFMTNMFRSNVEGIEKPRQIIVLVITIAGASYLVSL